MKKERINISYKELTKNAGQVSWLPANPRTWTADDIRRTEASVQEDPDFLEDRPLLVVADVPGKYVVFAGNLRCEAAARLRLRSVPCVLYTPEGPEDELAIVRRAMKDNGAFGAWDYDALANEWSDLPLAEWGVPAWEGEPDNATVPSVQEDDFDEDKAEIHVRCKPGDIWQLGDHRIMCGDSTDEAQVALLMNGERADIAFTSPPYGVKNIGRLRAHLESGNNEISPRNFYNKYDDTQGKWGDIMDMHFAAISEYSIQQFINVQMLAANRRKLMAWAAAHADRLVDVLIWDKGHAAPQMQPNIVNNNFEFIFVFGGENCSRELVFGDFKGNTDAIIRITTERNKYAEIHRAVFPVALPSEILRINVRARSVLDCFGGTGTTLIAAEQMGRKCYMMEIDPYYCDVIIARWEALTGKTAKRSTDTGNAQETGN
ncbi:MAG: DNA modification methylase [Bacteroidales bacterium]|nr:DNA modification methylase [Bacteroidales bacterium]